MPYKPSLSVSRGLIPENNQNKGEQAMRKMLKFEIDCGEVICTREDGRRCKYCGNYRPKIKQYRCLFFGILFSDEDDNIQRSDGCLELSKEA